jgi:hypothetical protein
VIEIVLFSVYFLDNHKSEGGVVAYQPPLRDPDVDLKRTMRKLTKLSQDAQK